MQGFIQISQVFPSHLFPVPGSSPGIHVGFFQIYFFGCVRSQLQHPGSCLHHVGGWSQIVYLLNLLNDESPRGWWGPSRKWLFHSAQCLAHSRCSGNLLPLSSSWSLSWLNLSSLREATNCIYWSRIKKTFQIFTTTTNPSCFYPMSSPSFWWLRKESFQHGVLWREDPSVLSDYGSYWLHMARECLKCG